MCSTRDQVSVWRRSRFQKIDVFKNRNMDLVSVKLDLVSVKLDLVSVKLDLVSVKLDLTCV